MPINMLNVCFSANDAYVAHFATACASLLHANKVAWRIFLLTDDLSEKNENRLHRMVSEKSAESTLEVIRVDAERFAHLPQKFTYLNVQTYFRLLIAELLPTSVDEVLFLDSDLVVVNDLTSYLENKVKPPIMAVADAVSLGNLKKRGLITYFNAGVLRIPLAYWREQNYGNSLLVHQAPVMDYADQEILNDFFKDQWHEMPTAYNVFSNKLPIFTFRRRNAAANIIHFLGAHKPWNAWVPGSSYYWKYRQQTPFKAPIYRIILSVIPGIKIALYKIFKK